MIRVDFCRGSGGAFLAVNNVVVAGVCNPDGSGRVIQAFEFEDEDLVVALRHPHVPASSHGLNRADQGSER
jgi:hypothetical protein